jgi:1,4-alpha-glucan branching enzyme
MNATNPKKDNKEHTTTFSEFDIALFSEGKHYMLYKHLGAQPFRLNGRDGIHFSVWAPNAVKVALIGDFNHWNGAAHHLNPRWDSSGIWELFVPDVPEGALYKFQIHQSDNTVTDKADPFAFRSELPPHTASRVPGKEVFKWSDKRWLNKRQKLDITEQPLSIYELHIGSWRRVPEESNRFMTYREIAGYLPAYCKETGFTHVEFMPIMEHPFYGSWGYQITGYFAASSRFGNANDFKYLVNTLHKEGIGIILDWVPSHFPGDSHGLYQFDGTHLYEHANPQEGYHPDWKSYIFNYGRNEVRAFLISNAIFWLDQFHIDGLRVDAVASMLYRDYSRKAGEWTPNHLGGRENLEAIAFLREFNEAVHTLMPGTFTVAEESTAFPGVTRSVADGGLGFDFKWMMGWMHDTLEYFKKDPVYRSFHHHQLTFSMHYAYSEKFVLPLSHDEVVHGKRSLLQKMPGDDWQKAANLRLLYAYMWGHPGGKLLFMGSEFGQNHEWQHDFSLDWHEAEMPFHYGLQLLIKDLNTLYNNEASWFLNNYKPEGFEWIDYNDTQNCVFCWLRKGKDENDFLMFIMNATPQVFQGYKFGIHQPFKLTEILNTDNVIYGGSNVLNEGLIEVQDISVHGRAFSISITLPPLGLIVFKPVF